MKKLIFSLGMALLLGSCRNSHDSPGSQLIGSWSVSPNQIFSYAEMYFHTDHSCFYFSLETGSIYLGVFQVYGNTLFCDDKAIGKIRQIHEKKLLLISDTGTDTLYFIDDLIVNRNRLINDEEFRTFTQQFSQRRKAFYVEKLGVDTEEIKETEEFK